MIGQGYGMQDYMGGGINPYMMGAQAMMFGGMGMNSGAYLNFKDEKDMKSFYNSKVDDSTASIYAGGQGRISQKAYAVAAQLKGALEEGDSSEAGEILKSVQNDKYELAGIEQAYDNMSGGRTALRQDIREGMGGSKLLNHLHLGAVNDLVQGIKKTFWAPFGIKPMAGQEAIDILNKGTDVNTVTAANALKEATMGAGTDKKTINHVVSSANGRMGEINSSYNQLGSNLNQDIRDGYFMFIDGPAAAEHVNTRIAGLLA